MNPQLMNPQIAGHSTQTRHRSCAIKYNIDGSIKVVKARFVACGYSQIESSDYDHVFASNLSSVSFRMLMGMIADEDLETDHTDAVKAFTQAKLQRSCSMGSLGTRASAGTMQRRGSSMRQRRASSGLGGLGKQLGKGGTTEAKPKTSKPGERG